MIDPTVRRATLDDASMLALLEAEARRSVAEMRGGERWLDEHPPLDWTGIVADRGSDRGIAVLVAHVDLVAVGYLVLDLERSPIARVDQVYVTPDAREIGFGDELVAQARSIAAQAGATHLEAEALPGDRQTKNLYERAGITARSITVSTRLDRARSS